MLLQLFYLRFVIGGFLVADKHVNMGSFDYQAVIASEGESVGLKHELVIFLEFGEKGIQFFLQFFPLVAVGSAFHGGVKLNGALPLPLNDLDIALKLQIGLDGV